MKRINYLIMMLALVIIGAVSCGKDDPEPTAAFEYTANKLVVSFTNKSVDATKYSWDFGDGNTSTDKNPTHTYVKNGTYKVTLKSENDSKSASTTKDIVANDGIDRGVQPAFNYEAEYLKVKYTNASLNATSYAWDFGDGNTSTDKDPEHTYEKEGTYTVKLIATGVEGSKDVSKDVTIKSQYKQSGYFLGAVASSSATFTYYGGYFETLPSEVDLTNQTGYERINMITTHKGFMYGWRTDNSAGLGKYAIDNETNELVEVDELLVDYYPSTMAIVSDELAYIVAYVHKKVVAINPKTMEIIKEVDLSSGKNLDEFDVAGYSAVYYNDKIGKIYAVANYNDQNTPPFYDLDKVYVEVIDAQTGTWEKTITHDNAQYPIIRGQVNNVIDAEGNLYLLCQGTYGLDNQIGPTANVASRPQIIKINTNSEFEEDYAFNPINQVGFQNNFFQLLTSMVGAGGNKAYAIGTAQVDSPEIQALLAKIAAGTITTEEYNQLTSLVLYDESMKLIEIDLVTKEARFVDGAPKTAGFGYPGMYNYDGKIYSTMLSNGATFNGIYEIDLTSNTAKPVINVTAGGVFNEFVDIGASF